MIIRFFRWCWHIVLAILNWCRKIFTKITKKEISDTAWESFIQFVKFGLMGFSNTAISFATYYILVPLGCNKYIASTIGFFLSIVNAYFWSNSYIFRKEDNEVRSPVKSFIKLLLSYAGTGFILSNGLLFLWTDVLTVSVYVAPVINLFITIPINFLLNKFWAFKDKKKKESEEK